MFSSLLPTSFSFSARSAWKIKSCTWRFVVKINTTSFQSKFPDSFEKNAKVPIPVNLSFDKENVNPWCLDPGCDVLINVPKSQQITSDSLQKYEKKRKPWLSFFLFTKQFEKYACCTWMKNMIKYNIYDAKHKRQQFISSVVLPSGRFRTRIVVPDDAACMNKHSRDRPAAGCCT